MSNHTQELDERLDAAKERYKAKEDAALDTVSNAMSTTHDGTTPRNTREAELTQRIADTDSACLKRAIKWAEAKASEVE